MSKVSVCVCMCMCVCVTQVQVNDLNLWVQGPLEDPTSATVKRWGNNVIGGDPYNNVEKV